MSLDATQTVLLCAAAGFVIVWLSWPSKAPAGASFRETADHSGGAFADGNSSKPEEDAGPEPEQEESDRPRSAHAAPRPRWCDILLLEPDAKPAAIRKAYARLMKGLHPDVAGANEYTSAQCAIVQEAYRQAMEHSRTR